MRQRITFVHKPENAIDPDALQVKEDGISGPDILGVREDRVTIALDELPREISRALKECHELHIRWVSSSRYETIDPLSSRLSPGFHLFYTPQREGKTDLRGLCIFLRRFFGHLDCADPESFIRLENTRFSQSAAFQFYQLQVDLRPFIKYVEGRSCRSLDENCLAQVGSLEDAVSLDISYDTISHALKLTAVWPHDTRTLDVRTDSKHRTELGILTAGSPPNVGPDEVGISGLLTILGEQQKPSPTLFSFPSRHRLGAGSFSSRFLEPHGLHPRLQLAMRSAMPPPTQNSHCGLHAYLTLPRTIFADRYQLADDLFSASKNLSTLQHSSQPVDLERPEYKTRPWGSTVLLQLLPPRSKEETDWTAEIPLHLRYLQPSDESYLTIEVSYPVVFWACPSEEGTKFPNNPFDRANLGYDGLFGPRTVFWHVEPRPTNGSLLTNSLRVPVVTTGRSSWVEFGTATGISLGFCWILYSLLLVFWGTSGKSVDRSVKEKAAEVRRKKKQ